MQHDSASYRRWTPGSRWRESNICSILEKMTTQTEARSSEAGYYSAFLPERVDAPVNDPDNSPAAREEQLSLDIEIKVERRPSAVSGSASRIPLRTA